MLELLSFVTGLFEPRTFVIIVIAALAFLSILTLVSQLLERQDRARRVDYVINEKERLRAEYLENLKKQKASSRLRQQSKGGIAQLVEALNLHKIFDAENTRKKLRQAGYRLEKHLVTFLAIRLLAPFVLAFIAYLYAPFVLGEDAAPNKILLIVILGFLVGNFLPGIWLTNAITKRRESIRDAWSDALDLMLICVESGQSIEQALNRVSLEIASQSRPLAEELQLTMAELSYLNDRRKALENLAERTGLPTVRSVVTAMIQSERYGTPLAQALRTLAKENRDERMQMVEKKAAALPPKLTVPLIVFFLPVIFIVLLGPAIIRVQEYM